MSLIRLPQRGKERCRSRAIVSADSVNHVLEEVLDETPASCSRWIGNEKQGSWVDEERSVATDVNIDEIERSLLKVKAEV